MFFKILAIRIDITYLIFWKNL